jgi:hypothetical protein
VGVITITALVVFIFHFTVSGDNEQQMGKYKNYASIHSRDVQSEYLLLSQWLTVEAASPIIGRWNTLCSCKDVVSIVWQDNGVATHLLGCQARMVGWVMVSPHVYYDDVSFCS